MTLKHNQSLGRDPWISLKPRLITSLELWTSVGVCPTKFKSRRSHCHSDQVWQRSTLIRGSQSYLKKCAVRQKSYYIYFLIFFSGCSSLLEVFIKTILMENAWRKQGHRYPQERLNYNSYRIFFQFTSRMLLTLLQIKGAVSRNSAKLGDYKMPVKLRETSAQNFKGRLKYHNRNNRCHGWAKLKNIETDWN